MLLVTSDAGSDQTLATKLLAHRHGGPGVAVVAQWCLQHQLHLVVERALLRGGHWARLAMLVHLWRGSGNAARIKQAFADLVGLEAAERCAGSPPPVPIRGRWGSATASEARVLRCDRCELLSVRRPQVCTYRCAVGLMRFSAPSPRSFRESCLAPFAGIARDFWLVCMRLSGAVRGPAADSLASACAAC